MGWDGQNRFVAIVVIDARAIIAICLRTSLVYVFTNHQKRKSNLKHKESSSNFQVIPSTNQQVSSGSCC